MGPKSLVTAEILLIWTGVVRTHVAWTNVTMTVGTAEILLTLSLCGGWGGVGGGVCKVIFMSNPTKVMLG